MEAVRKAVLQPWLPRLVAALAVRTKRKGQNRGESQNKRELKRWKDDHAKRLEAEHQLEVWQEQLELSRGEVGSLEIQNSVLGDETLNPINRKH